MKFTGFYEVMQAPGIEPEVACTIRYFDTEELLDRLRMRLEDVPPGARIRIDLIAWDGEAVSGHWECLACGARPPVKNDTDDAHLDRNAPPQQICHGPVVWIAEEAG